MSPTLYQLSHHGGAGSADTQACYLSEIGGANVATENLAQKASR